MAQNNNNVPENADKILFAEDLMAFMMLRNAGINVITNSNRYRDFIYNGFTDTVRQAVGFLDNTMERSNDNMFDVFKHINAVNRFTFMKFANDLYTKYFPEGFDANHFLHYCVHLGSLAVNFFSHGVTEAPHLAVMYIVYAIQYFDMFTGGWDTLQLMAERYCLMSFDFVNTLSPSSSNSDEDLEDYAVDIVVVNQEEDGELNGANGVMLNEHNNKLENVDANSHQNNLKAGEINNSNDSLRIGEKLDYVSKKDLNKEVENHSVGSEEMKSNDVLNIVDEPKLKDNLKSDIDIKDAKKEPEDLSVTKVNTEMVKSDFKQDEFVSNEKRYFKSREDSNNTELHKRMLITKKYFIDVQEKQGSSDDLKALNSGNFHKDITEKGRIDFNFECQPSTSASSVIYTDFELDLHEIQSMSKTSSTDNASTSIESSEACMPLDLRSNIKISKTPNNFLSDENSSKENGGKHKPMKYMELSPSSSETEN